MSFPVGLLQPGASKEYDFEVYAGPKDYMGLKSLGADQKKVMQFGILVDIGTIELGFELFKRNVRKLWSWNHSADYHCEVNSLALTGMKPPRSQKKMQSLQGQWQNCVRSIREIHRS